jgi:hypothetical protein
MMLEIKTDKIPMKNAIQIAFFIGILQSTMEIKQ